MSLCFVAMSSFVIADNKAKDMIPSDDITYNNNMSCQQKHIMFFTVGCIMDCISQPRQEKVDKK